MRGQGGRRLSRERGSGADARWVASVPGPGAAEQPDRLGKGPGSRSRPRGVPAWCRGGHVAARPTAPFSPSTARTLHARCICRTAQTQLVLLPGGGQGQPRGQSTRARATSAPGFLCSAGICGVNTPLPRPRNRVTQLLHLLAPAAYQAGCRQHLRPGGWVCRQGEGGARPSPAGCWYRRRRSRPHSCSRSPSQLARLPAELSRRSTGARRGSCRPVSASHTTAT